MGKKGILCKLLGDCASALYDFSFTDIYEGSPDYPHKVHTVMITEFPIFNCNDCILQLFRDLRERYPYSILNI